MEIIETSIFTRLVSDLLSSEAYRELQSDLVMHPDAGAVIAGSGGLRKLRWAGSGRGKRGGVRVIYYWVTARNSQLMLYIYPKNEKDDLTDTQIKTLRAVVEKEYK